MTAVTESNNRPTLIGRPALVNPAERARILQSQRAAALRRRNVQLRIAKIEAEPAAEWQSSSKPLTLHHHRHHNHHHRHAAIEPTPPQPVPAINDDESSMIEESPSSVLPSRDEAESTRTSTIATRPENAPRPRTSSLSPHPIQSQSPSSSEYTSSLEEEKEEGIRGLVDDDSYELEPSSPAKIGRPIPSSRGGNTTSSPTDVVASESSNQFDIARLGLDDSARMREFLTSPCPKEAGTIQCYIRRHKAGAKKSLFPEYRVYLKEHDTFLLTSKKRKNKKTANYLISMGRNDFDKASDNIVGKLRSNFLGTEFQIYDSGRNPNNSTAYFDERTDVPIRSELGAVVYSSNFIGSRGPRQMQVCINRIDDDTDKPTKAWQPAHRDEEMIQCFKHRVPAALRHLVVLENKEPQWNEDLGAHVLNFNGRVTQASVKNFQLIDKSTHHHNEGRLDKRITNDGDSSKSKSNHEKDVVVLQFGRVAKDEFTLDFRWPMSPVQAFAIALSSCDAKLACE
jgi:tubby-related protein 1